jgi:hypothetical protein
MANQWLRLWHDMPTDPKWRTIAKASGQRIGDVMAVYCHLLVCASNATERGRTQSFNCEDVASALDIETEQVAAIFDAMQGRVLEGDQVSGWEKRQAAREDGSAERAKAWREAKKAGVNADRTQANAAERNQTPDKDKSREEEIREEKKTTPLRDVFVPPDWIPSDTWVAYLKTRTKKRSDNNPHALNLIVKDLEDFKSRGFDALAILETSIKSGWAGVFEPKAQAGDRGGGKQSALEARNRQVALRLMEST